MPQLTDTQLVILNAAAQREGGAVLPLPPSLTLNRGAVALVLKGLAKRGLIAERPAGREDAVWREAEGQRLMLAITDAGLEALGVDPEAAPDPDPDEADAAPEGSGQANRDSASEAPARPEAAAAPPRTGAKSQVLVELLRRDEGASIAEISAATGWQAHSVRGAISGTLKKKRGLAVTSEKVEGRGRVYRIAGQG